MVVPALNGIVHGRSTFEHLRYTPLNGIVLLLRRRVRSFSLFTESFQVVPSLNGVLQSRTNFERHRAWLSLL